MMNINSRCVLMRSIFFFFFFFVRVVFSEDLIITALYWLVSGMARPPFSLHAVHLELFFSYTVCFEPNVFMLYYLDVRLFRIIWKFTCFGHFLLLFDH